MMHASAMAESIVAPTLFRPEFSHNLGQQETNRAPFPERPHLGVQLTKIQKSGHWIFNVGC